MSLNKVTNIANMSVSEKLENNVISMLDWGFTDKGGYINIDINQSGDYVDNRSSLTRVTDVRNQSVYWQGPENWVYESGISVGTANNVPLIYVNNVLNTGCTINYRDGQVTTPTGVTATSVKAEFAYKWITFTSSRNSNSLRRLQARQNRFDIDNGEVNIPAEVRVPMPCVTIDCPPVSKSRPYGIGGPISATIYTHEIDLQIVGETASEAVRIADYICAQKGNEFLSYDPYLVKNANNFPLTFKGRLNSGKNHDQLCALYPWANIYILDARATYGAYLDQNIYQTNVRITTEIKVC